MIAKPTTMEQATQNAIEAAENAHTAAMGLYANIGPGARSKVWADVSLAWSKIADVLPMRKDYTVTADDVPISETTVWMRDTDDQDGEEVVVSKEDYNVMRALAIESIERRAKRGPMNPPILIQEEIDATAHKVIGVQSIGRGAWGLSVQ